jgi:hypothetical protein
MQDTSRTRILHLVDRLRASVAKTAEAVSRIEQRSSEPTSGRIALISRRIKNIEGAIERLTDELKEPH